MAGNKKSEKHNARKGSRQLSPREELEIKQRLKRKEKKSTIIKRAITSFILTTVVLVALVGVYLFSFISSVYIPNIPLWVFSLTEHILFLNYF